MEQLKQIGQFAIVPVWVMRRCCKHPEALRLYAWLAGRYANTEHEAWPGQNTLSVDLEVSVDTIQRQLQVLRDLGVLTTERRPLPGGGSKALVYVLLVVEPDESRTDAVFESSESRIEPPSKAASVRVAYKDQPDPITKPSTERVSRGSRSRKRRPEVEHGPFVRPGHGHRQPHYWCGEFFCISAEKHLKHHQRTHAAGEQMTDADWDVWYREKDQAWGEIDIEEREPKGPMYWLWGRMSDDLAGV